MVKLLRDLIALNLAHPSFISVGANDHGTYDLVLKNHHDAVAIRAFLADKNLILCEGKEGMCRIYKP